MAWPIFVWDSTSGTTSGSKVRLTSKWRPFWKFLNILDRFILTSDMERPSEINPKKVLLMLMTSLTTSQRDVKVRWKKEMDTDSAYLTDSQYIQSYWFSNKSNINIIYNISVITITIAITIILANLGKYAISDCPFITCQNYHFGKYVGWSCLSVCLSVCTEISQNLKNESANHHQTWSQVSTSPWFLQVRWTRI